MLTRLTFVFLSAHLTASASGLFLTGTLGTPESALETTFTLPSAQTVTFQTWGFGGGTNGAGTPIPAGGFDPLLSLFAGSISTATIYVDGSGNPLADADNLLNAPWSYVGNCPPAGTVAIGTGQDCGDDFMQLILPAGTYTLVLTDANYIPAAIYDNGALSEGFVDFTNGVFQTCDPVSNACITPNGNYAADILFTAAPEPGSLALLSLGLAALAGLGRRFRRQFPHTKGAEQ
jgi:hypothetical protein